jgi:hypothetical protein
MLLRGGYRVIYKSKEVLLDGQAMSEANTSVTEMRVLIALSSNHWRGSSNSASQTTATSHVGTIQALSFGTINWKGGGPSSRDTVEVRRKDVQEMLRFRFGFNLSVASASSLVNDQ